MNFIRSLSAFTESDAGSAPVDGNAALANYFAVRPIVDIGTNNRYFDAWKHFVSSYLNEDNLRKLCAYFGDTGGIIAANPWLYYDLPDKAKRFFADYLDATNETDFIVHDDPQSAPAWMLLTPVGDSLLPASTWLVHISDHAAAIRQHGFRLGVPDVDRIALTYEWNVFSNRPVPLRYGAPGYNYAYLADGSTNLEYHTTRHTGSLYGDSAILFRSSGLLVHHSGDRENQVVFWGPAADAQAGIVLDRTPTGSWTSTLGGRARTLDNMVRRLVTGKAR